MTKQASQKKKRTTLRDVAKHTGVSPMTVSNVANRKFEYVSDSTRKKILKAIDKLNYVPSATSRKLRSMQEYSIGMIIMDDEPAFLVNPFISQLVAGLSNYLSESNYTLTIQGVRMDEFEKSSLFSMVGTDALCAILCGNDDDRNENVKFLLGRNQPVVLFQDTIFPRSSNIAVINQRDEEGGELIASHVLSKGAKDLLFMQPSIEWPAIEKRKKGILNAVSKVKAARCRVISCGQASFQQTQEALNRFLDEAAKPDAILGGTDAIGIAALRLCQDRGYDVPDDVMVTGFNGFESSQFTNPSLTTVVSPAYEMGRSAGKLIIKRLESNRFSRRRTEYEVKLKLGGSA